MCVCININSQWYYHMHTLLTPMQCFLIATQKRSDISFAISERVNIHTFLGVPVTKSSLLTGLLLEYHVDSSCGSDIESTLERVREQRGDIVTALFDVSLAGDLPEGNSEILWSQSIYNKTRNFINYMYLPNCSVSSIQCALLIEMSSLI